MSQSSDFKDYFSQASDHYDLYRPTYPDDIFSYLADLTTYQDTAWDCATGTGQSAVSLSRYFEHVIATDGSANQIKASQIIKNIDYRIEMAEKSTLPDQSVDLVTVGQALHWFNFDVFFSEVRRVLKPNSYLAVWCYSLINVESYLNELIQNLYFNTLSEYWPEERQYLEQGYSDIHFPFLELNAPQFVMRADWTLEQLVGYLNTWSAVKKYNTAQGSQLIESLIHNSDLITNYHMGKINVSWPLTLRVFKNNELISLK